MNPYKTLKASTLNNRAVRRTPGEETHTESTLKESPLNGLGHSFRVLTATIFSPQVLRTLRLLSVDAFSVLRG